MRSLRQIRFFAISLHASCLQEGFQFRDGTRTEVSLTALPQSESILWDGCRNPFRNKDVHDLLFAAGIACQQPVDASISFLLLLPLARCFFLDQISPEFHLVFMAEHLCSLTTFLGDPCEPRLFFSSTVGVGWEASINELLIWHMTMQVD
jgi:hypothetical protein